MNKMSKSENKFLVFGATGAFGGALAIELLEADKQVFAVSRKEVKSIPNIPSAPNLRILKGDILNIDDFSIPCQYIVFAMNVPYTEWAKVMPKALDNCIELAKKWNSTIVFPGNVYSLKPVYNVFLKEDQPLEPISAKGELRKQMEIKLQASGVKTLVIRGNDYFGPTCRNGLVDMIFKNAVEHKSVQCLGKDIIHEFCYLPDLARATVGLLDSMEMKGYEVVHFKGYCTLTRNQFATRVIDLANKLTKSEAKVGISNLSWFGLKMYGFFNNQVKELVELSYLFDNSLLLDDKKFKQHVPTFLETDLDKDIEETLKSYIASATPTK